MMKIHHIGYLVQNIEKAQAQFKELGFTESTQLFSDELRGIYIIYGKRWLCHRTYFAIKR